MRKRTWAVAALLLAVSGRAFADPEGESAGASPAILTVGGLFLFYNESAPLSFVTPVSGELPKDRQEFGEVFGRSCQHGVSLPTSLSIKATDISAAAGDGGYYKALKNIREAHPGLQGLYDVKVDIQSLSILGLYRRQCTEVSGRGFALTFAAPPRP